VPTRYDTSSALGTLLLDQRRDDRDPALRRTEPDHDLGGARLVGDRGLGTLELSVAAGHDPPDRDVLHRKSGVGLAHDHPQRLGESGAGRPVLLVPSGDDDLEGREGGRDRLPRAASERQQTAHQSEPAESVDGAGAPVEVRAAPR
jgi:hypothetical protein